jgi:hypothetical protein
MADATAAWNNDEDIKKANNCTLALVNLLLFYTLADHFLCPAENTFLYQLLEKRTYKHAQLRCGRCAHNMIAPLP